MAENISNVVRSRKTAAAPRIRNAAVIAARRRFISRRDRVVRKVAINAAASSRASKAPARSISPSAARLARRVVIRCNAAGRIIVLKVRVVRRTSAARSRRVDSMARVDRNHAFSSSVAPPRKISAHAKEDAVLEARRTLTAP